jgi:DNA polymerase III sliding clamp (beta) subunit (PCNA family)
MNTNELKNFCAKAKKIITNKHPLPILDYVLIENGQITASDLETTLIHQVSGLDGLKGTILFKDLCGIVDKLKNQEVNFEFSEKVIPEKETCFYCKIVSKKGTFNFTTENPAYFPQLPSPFEDQPFEFLSAGDIDLIKKVSKYALKDELRPILSTVLVGYDIAATDTSILTFNKRERSTKPFMIKQKVVSLLESMPYSCFENVVERESTDWIDGKKMVEKHTVIRNIKLITDSETIIYRAVEGTYPDYQQVIPDISRVQSEVLLQSDELKEILDLCAMSVNKASGLIRFVNSPMFGSLTISCQDIDFGKSFTHNIEVENTGEEIEIGFNLDYLQKIITTEKVDGLHFKFVDPETVALINDNMLLMPMHMNPR